MRIFYLLFFIVLLPEFCFAQRDFTEGTYKLQNGTTNQGQLKYTSGSGAELIVKAGKKKLTFPPEAVEYFQVGEKHFVPVADFVLDNGMPMMPKTRIKQDFAEVVDTGRVELLRYSFPTSNMKMPMQGVVYAEAALIRRRGEPLQCIPIIQKKAKPIIASCLKDRPDLVARLNKEKYTVENIRAIIQAYNTPQ